MCSALPVVGEELSFEPFPSIQTLGDKACGWAGIIRVACLSGLAIVIAFPENDIIDPLTLQERQNGNRQRKQSD